MTDITHEYATDPLTGETVAIDPPLQESDAPLMGNPVLTRRTAPRRAGSNTALYATGAALAVLVLGGGAYVLASGAHQQSLTTTSPSTPPPQVVAEAAAPAPVPTPVVTPAPAPVVASAEQPVEPVRITRATPSMKAEHRAERHQAARAAEDESADTSASAPQGRTPPPVVTQSQVAAPPVAASQPAPTAAPPAESAPVITPPSN